MAIGGGSIATWGQRVLLAAACVAAVLATGASAGPAPSERACAQAWWPQPRQNACGTRSVASAEAPSPANVGAMQQVWSVELGSDPGMPIVAKGPVMRSPFVYVWTRGGGGKGLKAFELTTGRLRWTAKGASLTPASAGDLLLAGGTRYVLRSGHVVWRRPIRIDDSSLEPPAIADGNWYRFDNGGLEAFDARTGRPHWSFPVDCFHCGVAAAAGRVYVAGGSPAGDGAGASLHALDAATGSQLWKAASEHVDYSTGASPVLAAGRVFVRTMAGKYLAREFAIEAYSARDGTLLWRAPVGTARGFWFTPPAANESLVAYASEDGSLYALDASTGHLRWKASGIENGVAPAIANGVVWAGDDASHFVALDAATGRRLWTSPRVSWRQGIGIPAPIVAGPYLLILDNTGKLTAYRARSA